MTQATATPHGICSNHLRIGRLRRAHFRSRSGSSSKPKNGSGMPLLNIFFIPFRLELIFFERYETRAEARKNILGNIEIFCNRNWRHSALNMNLLWNVKGGLW